MKHNGKSRFIFDRFLLTGILLALFFWAAESFIHAYIFHEGTFAGQLVTTELNEFWMRVLIVAMLLLFSLYAAVVVSRLKRSREELWESEEKYRRIIDTAEEGVCILDREDKISFVNRKFAEMFGYTMEEMTGRAILSLADGEGRAPVEAALARHHRGEREKGDFRLKRSDGSDIWLIVSAAPMFGKNGEYEGSLAMVNDITGRKKAEQVIAERLDELERFRKATVERELRIKELKDRLGVR